MFMQTIVWAMKIRTGPIYKDMIDTGVKEARSAQDGDFCTVCRMFCASDMAT